MRGNRAALADGRTIVRSIPAYAGEPTWLRDHTIAERVYPRVCGGTGVAGGGVVYAGGLSPRMRGNLKHAVSD